MSHTVHIHKVAFKMTGDMFLGHNIKECLALLNIVLSFTRNESVSLPVSPQPGIIPLLTTTFNTLYRLKFLLVTYEGQSISNASYFFLLYFLRKLKYNCIA